MNDSGFGGRMREWSDRIWIAEAPLRFYGVPFGTRMTVVRLADGGLLVHSPLDPVPPLRAEIDALGPVRYVVSPNKLHHLFLGGFLQAYPSAQLFAPPGLASKRRDLRFDGGNDAIIDRHIHYGIDAVAGVDDVSVSNHQVVGLCTGRTGEGNAHENQNESSSGHAHGRHSTPKGGSGRWRVGRRPRRIARTMTGMTDGAATI